MLGAAAVMRAAGAVLGALQSVHVVQHCRAGPLACSALPAASTALAQGAESGSLCLVVPAVVACADAVLSTASLASGPVQQAVFRDPGWGVLAQVHAGVAQRIADTQRYACTRAHLQVWLETAACAQHDMESLGLVGREARGAPLAGLDGTAACLGFTGCQAACPALATLLTGLTHLPMRRGDEDGKSAPSPTPSSADGQFSPRKGRRQRLTTVLVSVPESPKSAAQGAAQAPPPAAESAPPQIAAAEPAAPSALQSAAFQGALLHGYLHRHPHTSALADAMGPAVAEAVLESLLPSVVGAAVRSATRAFHQAMAKRTAEAGGALLDKDSVEAAWQVVAVRAQAAAREKAATLGAPLVQAAVSAAVSTALLPQDCVGRGPGDAGTSRKDWLMACASALASDIPDEKSTAALVAGDVAAQLALPKLDAAAKQLAPVHVARAMAAVQGTSTRTYWKAQGPE